MWVQRGREEAEEPGRRKDSLGEEVREREGGEDESSSDSGGLVPTMSAFGGSRDVPAVELGAERLVEADEGGFARAVVGCTSAWLNADGFRQLTHLCRPDQAEYAGHRHHVTFSGPYYGGKESLEDPKMSESIGAKGAEHQPGQPVNGSVARSCMSSGVRSSSSLPLTTPALLTRIVGSPT